MEDRAVAALADLDWPVRTARLQLRPLRLDDLEATWAYRRLEEVGRWLSGRRPKPSNDDEA